MYIIYKQYISIYTCTHKQSDVIFYRPTEHIWLTSLKCETEGLYCKSLQMKFLLNDCYNNEDLVKDLRASDGGRSVCLCWWDSADCV